MEYRLIGSRGFIVDCTATVNKAGELDFKFSGIDTETVVFLVSGQKRYRTTKNGVCSVPVGFLELGVITPVVLTKAEVVCESFIVAEDKHGQVIATAANDDYRTRIIDTEIAAIELKAEIKNLKEELQSISRRISEIYDGYDVD